MTEITNVEMSNTETRITYEPPSVTQIVIVLEEGFAQSLEAPSLEDEELGWD